MHVDPEKKFDKRSVEGHIRDGFVSQKEYDDYLASLPDVSDKAHQPEETPRKAKG
jgi:hypothetical protein